MKARHRLPAQVCPVCKCLFIPARKGTMYCSSAHKVASHRAKRAEEALAEARRLANPQLEMAFSIDNNQFTEADMRMLRGGK